MFKRPFVLYLLSQALGTLTTAILSVAVGWHLYQATGRAFDLALVGLMQIIPIAGLFIVSGWVVDNVRRKHVLIACAALRALVLFGLAFAFGTGELDRFAVFGLLFLNGVSRAFYMPASQSILPGLVEQKDMTRAVAFSSTIWTAGETIGPFAAGFLIAWLDTKIYFLLGMLALLACVLFIFLPSIQVRRPTGRGLDQLLDGVRYVWRNPLVLPAITLDLFIVLVGSIVALLPIFAIDILQVGPEVLGLMRAMPALGAVLAGIALTRITMRRSGRLLFASLGMFAMSIIVFALSGSLTLSLNHVIRVRRDRYD